MNHQVVAFLFFCTGLCSAQNLGGFYFTLTPKTATVGEAVTFECQRFEHSLFSYKTTWEKEPTPISSKKTFMLRLISKRNEAALPMGGYSGPKVIFELEEPAVYRILFDSTSDFKESLGDTAVFEVVQPLSVRDKRVTTTLKKYWSGWIFEGKRIDGRVQKVEAD